jgi:serine protease Do
MKTFVKSFAGGAIASTIILVFAWVIFQQSAEKTKNPPNSTNEIYEEYATPPVHRTAYGVPQGVDFSTAAEKTVNAVVHIKTEMRAKTSSYDNFFGGIFGNPYRSNTFVAFGSGVIISPDGYIVTNNHVVEGADRITVTFNDKREMIAQIVGTDPTTDLALIKVDGEDLTYLTYGDSDELKVGEWVLAVGNPFNLTSTVTAGIVSAKARNIRILGAQSSIESFIQTDAAVNRGNSGGALVNINGDLVGINAAIASHTGVYEGYSFAIPVNIVGKVVEDLMRYGEIQRAYIGVQIQDIDADFANEIGLQKIEGIYVASVVANSGADDAGLQQGDVILAIDDAEINSVSELMGTVAQHNPGDVVQVRINRDNNYQTYAVTLKNQNQTTALVRSSDEFYNETLGASFQRASSSELNKLGLSSGLKIVDIENGILRQGGISKGFIITDVNGVPVNSEGSLNEAMQSSRRNYVSLRGIYPNGTRVSYEFML